MLTHLKRAIRFLLPAPFRSLYQLHQNRRQTNAERFGDIYRRKLWGGDQHADFYSGAGSAPELVEGYIASVRHLLADHPRPRVVEIGCGDFAVGNRLTDLSYSYTACDVVPELIERNRRTFIRHNLAFVAIDAVTEPLPRGDIVIVRQVFQHLRNDQIQSILKKLTQYSTWIISEHIPSDKHFVPNVDMLAGAGNRLSMKSGIVLTERPFFVKPRSSQILSEVEADSGVIQTIAYVF